jgi:hypothetical protein
LIGKIINKKNKEIFAQKLTIQMQSILIEVFNERLEKEEISKEEEA